MTCHCLQFYDPIFSLFQVVCETIVFPLDSCRLYIRILIIHFSQMAKQKIFQRKGANTSQHPTSAKASKSKKKVPKKPDPIPDDEDGCKSLRKNVLLKTSPQKPKHCYKNL